MAAMKAWEQHSGGRTNAQTFFSTNVVFLTVQEFRRKGALNAMNVFSNLSATSDRPEPPYDKSGDESRSVCE